MQTEVNVRKDAQRLLLIFTDGIGNVLFNSGLTNELGIEDEYNRDSCFAKTFLDALDIRVIVILIKFVPTPQKLLVAYIYIIPKVPASQSGTDFVRCKISLKYVATRQGLEPRLTAPKTVVLPLDDRVMIVFLLYRIV